MSLSGFLSTTESVTTTPPPSSTSSYSTLPTPLYTHLSEAEIAIVNVASVIVAVTSMVGVVIYNKQLSKIIGGLLHCQHVNKDQVKYPIEEVGARIVNPGTPPEGPQAPSSPVTSAAQPRQVAEPTGGLRYITGRKSVFYVLWGFHISLLTGTYFSYEWRASDGGFW